MTENGKDIWAGALKLSPRAARFIYGGYLVLAVAAIVLSWRLAPSALFGTSVIILVLATIVTLLTQGLGRRNTYPAVIALWSVLTGCILLAILFVSSAFFGFPEKGATLVARFLKQNELAVLHGSNPAVDLGPGNVGLPAVYKTEPEADGDRFDRISELSKRGPVTLKGATVVLDGRAFYFGTLRIEDTKFVTMGQNVTIEAVRIEAVGNASINSFPSNLSSAQGSSGGQLKLIVYDRLRGLLSVDLSGTAGRRGGSRRSPRRKLRPRPVRLQTWRRRRRGRPARR